MKKVIGAILIIGVFVAIFIGEVAIRGLKETVVGFAVGVGMLFIVWAGVTLWQDDE